MIYGIGIDIVHIPKFKKAIEKWGGRFTHKIFTQNEIAYCEKRKSFEQHLAARFAAKEAFIKAMGKAVRFSDIEVLNNQDGKPYFNLQPSAFSLQLKTHLTISHSEEYGIAQVILEIDNEVGP